MLGCVCLALQAGAALQKPMSSMPLCGLLWRAAPGDLEQAPACNTQAGGLTLWAGRQALRHLAARTATAALPKGARAWRRPASPALRNDQQHRTPPLIACVHLPSHLAAHLIHAMYNRPHCLPAYYASPRRNRTAAHTRPAAQHPKALFMNTCLPFIVISCSFVCVTFLLAQGVEQG